jgi:two-component system, LytTR family, sensor kinase
MNLEMKRGCEQCAAALAADGIAYICSFECTFCFTCAMGFDNRCPHCAGELVLRPRRTRAVVREREEGVRQTSEIRSPLLWLVSFGIWAFVSTAATTTIYEMYRLADRASSLRTIAGMEFSSILTYAPLTPFAFAFAMKYPVQRGNWIRRSLLHLLAGITFTMGHVAAKAATPYGYYDPAYHEWTSAIWNSHLGRFRDPWMVAKNLFLVNVVDDISGAYLPIIIMAHAKSYYRTLRAREVHASELEGQLAKARLQTLKTQLQPHFLFNTLHSISALMLTDVIAADRMMTSLSDLLRMSLEKNATQVVTLSREMEFLNVYLDIEKTRFEERLRVVVEIAPECLDAQVPHLLLQPVVENAVRHGVSRRSTPGEIRIGAGHEGGQLHLWVRDDGPGFPNASDKKSPGGRGLQLTRERLFAMYGSEQTCEIGNSPSGGGEVHLRMPFCTMPPGALNTADMDVG